MGGFSLNLDIGRSVIAIREDQSTNTCFIVCTLELSGTHSPPSIYVASFFYYPLSFAFTLIFTFNPSSRHILFISFYLVLRSFTTYFWDRLFKRLFSNFSSNCLIPVVPFPLSSQLQPKFSWFQPLYPGLKLIIALF